VVDDPEQKASPRERARQMNQEIAQMIFRPFLTTASLCLVFLTAGLTAAFLMPTDHPFYVSAVMVGLGGGVAFFFFALGFFERWREVRSRDWNSPTPRFGHWPGLAEKRSEESSSTRPS
jgi:hypothetical protein